MGSKERIDTLLVQRGFFDSREKAKRAVMAGLVFSQSERLDKPGMKISTELPLEVKGQALKYVSRGGLKLEKAISCFNLDLAHKCVLDIGASTGGFTDCALQNGADVVYALDVGYGQLDWKLRSDPRVVVMERTNFRYVKPEDLHHGMPNFATIDVSFISLGLILPPLFPLLQPNSDVISLIKPQFEAGREHVGKKGVVRDPHIHQEVLKKTIRLAVKSGFKPIALDFSPITGGEGNIEFLLHSKKEAFIGMKDSTPSEEAQQELSEEWSEPIESVVRKAHEQFHSL